MIGPVMRGSTCRVTIRSSVTPDVRAAATYSSSRTVMTALRMTRMTPAEPRMPTVIIAAVIDEPNTDSTARATMIVGTESMRSVRFLVTRSAQPPRYPAARPTGRLMISRTARHSTTPSSVTWPPYSSRLSTSRPSSSVPRRWSVLGPARTWFRSWSSGW